MNFAVVKAALHGSLRQRTAPHECLDSQTSTDRTFLPEAPSPRSKSRYVPPGMELSYPPPLPQRHLPVRGFSAGIVLLGVGAIMIWGHRRSKQAISERR